jgi:dihydropteroate synthase
VFAVPAQAVEGLPQPGRCLVMGIVNVTPDSFSDGGLYASTAAAVEHGKRLLADGADLVDVGGESTRPGAVRPSLDEELKRVIPVVEELAAVGGLVTIDTMRAEVAARAIAAGAVGVNDVSGGLADPEMLAMVAESEKPYICMHWRGHSTRMAELAKYDDVLTEVRRELADRVDVALAAGIEPTHLAVDPGLGFAKTAEHNWEVLAGFTTLTDLGYPVVVGASRKAFLGSLLADAEGPRPPAGREDATAAISVMSAERGAWCVRVHDVRRSLDAILVAHRWAGEGG